MKNILFIIIIMNFIGCSKKSGYLYDEDLKKTIVGVRVQDMESMNNVTFTNSEGRFSFNDCGDLIISHKGYKTDTLKKYGCKPNGKCFDGHIFYMKKLK